MSQEITSFEVSTNFESIASEKKYSYVYGYVSRVQDGALAALKYKDGTGSGQNPAFSKTALVDRGIFPELQRIVQKYDFAKSNGRSCFVNGLPGRQGRISVVRDERRTGCKMGGANEEENNTVYNRHTAGSCNRGIFYV